MRIPKNVWPRTLVRKVKCPECGAEPGEYCRGVRGPRVSNHVDRIWKAKGLL